MQTTPPSGRPGDPLAQLATITLGEEPLPAILDRVVHLAKGVLPGMVEVSVTLVGRDGGFTVASTNDTAVALDKRQYDDERGPCLDATLGAQRCLVPDTRAETRWPRYAAAAVERGVLSSMSVPLPIQRDITGALNFHAADVDAFTADSIELAETFAAHAAVAVANADLYEATAAVADQMRAAMASRAVIEQAKGIIMRDRRCSADEAFDALVRLSQDSNVKLREVAQRLVDQVTR